jgi:hypothetical protein
MPGTQAQKVIWVAPALQDVVPWVAELADPAAGAAPPPLHAPAVSASTSVPATVRARCPLLRDDLDIMANSFVCQSPVVVGVSFRLSPPPLR